MGGLGLVAFALIVWLALREWRTAAVLLIATVVWFLVAVSIWQVRETLCRRLRAHRPVVLTHTLCAPGNRKLSGDRGSHFR